MTILSMRRRGVLAAIGMTSAAGLGWKAPNAAAAPSRPDGYAQIVAAFGQPCDPGVGQGHASSWKYGNYSGNGGTVTVYMHSLLANEVNLARSAVVNGPPANSDLLNYGIGGGYGCRPKDSGEGYSTHSWGISIDTNTAYNQKYTGCYCWNGRGWSGANYGNQLPDIWKSTSPYYVNFKWGITWDDPHHFQYATGY